MSKCKSIIQFECDEPEESITLAIVALVTASQLLGDALRVEIDPETRQQLTDILGQVDNSLDALRDVRL